VNYAQSVNRARTGVDAAIFAAAWADGRALPLEQVIAEALADDATSRAVGA
jgi:hypothetical protein